MKASEAFNTVCSMVADKYKDDGWEYAKSNHWMTKKDKKFKYQVRFYTDWNNVSDLIVSFYGAGSIKSLKSKEDVFWTDNIRCNVPKAGIDWNVAKREDFIS